MGDDNRVLSLRPLSVVQPSSRILSIALEILEGKVVSRSQFPSPPRTHGIQDEVADVEIIVSLVCNESACLHGDVESVVVGPTAPHRCPLVRLVREEAVERKTTPPGTGDTGIIPEHTPRFSRITLITLVENVLGNVVFGSVEGDRVGGGGKLVGAVVTVIEQGGRSVDIHVEKASVPEPGVRVQQTVVGASRGQESRSHLGVTGGTKVPIVGCLGPGTVGSDAVDAAVQSVVDGLAEEVLGSSSGVVTEDRESTKGKATIANTIPVTRDAGSPPSEGDRGSIEDGPARPQAVEDHVVPHLLLLVIAQNVVKPIVSNGISGNHLSGIQKVACVPLVSRWTERARDRVLCGGLAADHFRSPS